MTQSSSAIPAACAVCVPFVGATPLDWLRRQPPIGPRVYWRDSSGKAEMAGIGAAHQVCMGGESAFDTLRALQVTLRDRLPGARAFGGLRFDPARPRDAHWTSFADIWFCVPRIVALQDDRAGCRLQAWVPAGGDAAATRRELEQMVAEMAAAPAVGALPGRVLSRQDVPERPDWNETMEAALHTLASGELSKIVLARRSTLSFAQPPDPLALLQRLCAVTRDCSLFFFQPEADGAAFLGASPECLFARDGEALATEALAGTRPRGLDPGADRRLGDELRASDKDRREHAAVRDAILEALSPLCVTRRADAEPQLRRFARSQHLRSAIDATLRSGVAHADVLAALHPTPAVGGTPTAAALARLREWEPFDRGWYAGPVGWMSADAAEFAVAIRSALCNGREVALYAGAGIVKGSTADGEWEEIAHKMRDFARVLEETGP
jgi:menaquinone-specific isochorismate synthase